MCYIDLNEPDVVTLIFHVVLKCISL